MGDVPIGVIVVLSFGGVIVASTLGYWARELFSGVRRELDVAALLARAKKTPRVEIARAHAGDLVRIVGVVQAGQTFEAPLSARSVVAHETVVDAIVKSQATRLAYERLAIDFVVDDGTGRARIAMAGAALLLVVEPSPALPTAIGRFLARRGQAPVGLARAREGVLMPGMQVAVVGRARWEVDPDPVRERPDATYRASAEPHRLVVEAEPGAPVLAATVPEALARW